MAKRESASRSQNPRVGRGGGIRGRRRQDLSQGGRRAPRPQDEIAAYGKALELQVGRTELKEKRSAIGGVVSEVVVQERVAKSTEEKNIEEKNTEEKNIEAKNTREKGEERGEDTAKEKAEEKSTSNTRANLKQGLQVITDTLATLSDSPGCYRMLDAAGKPLYVGMARNLRRRVAAYTKPERQPQRIARMISLTRAMEIVETATEVEALLLETNLIKRLEPRYNVLLRDDKSFPYILITQNHEFPRLMRHRGVQTQAGNYFGPFAGVGSVRHTLGALERAFLLRTCSDSVFANRSRPCLLFHMHRCAAPCVGKIDREDYESLVQQARDTLTGDDKKIRSSITREMEQAAQQQEYERAARLRDRLRALATITGEQNVNLDPLDNADLFALAKSGERVCVQVFFFRGGRNYGNRACFPRGTEGMDEAQILSETIALFYEKIPPPPQILVSHKPNDCDLLEQALSARAERTVRVHRPQRGVRARALAHALHNAEAALLRRLAGSGGERFLAALGETLGLEEAPQRVEVFDNSHLRGTFPYGAMIVADKSGFARSSYRKFRIRDTTSGEDDYTMMREVLTRRLHRLAEEEKSADGEAVNAPDLWILDGGRGQLSIAEQVLAEYQRDDIALLAVAKGPHRNAGEERLFVPGQSQAILLPKDSETLHYIQRLRDEAHRYVIGSHRKGRGKEQLRSRLDSVPGVGAKRRQALLRHFGDAQAVARASVPDIARVSGISETLARQILASLRD